MRKLYLNSGGELTKNKKISVISKSIIMTVRKKIVGLVSLRNILVHVRLRIDRDIVYENLTHLDDFQQFIKYLTRNLNQ